MNELPSWPTTAMTPHQWDVHRFVGAVEVYVQGFAHGSGRIPCKYPALKAYRAGWIDGVESRDSRAA